MKSLYLREKLHLKDISQYNDFLIKIDVAQLSCKQSWSKDMERGNGGTIFPHLAVSTRSVGVLNGGEAQFEGVWVRPSCVFHLVVVHHSQSLHGIIDGLPL